VQTSITGNTSLSSNVAVLIPPGDPYLGPLQNNGGPTATMEVLSASPVFNYPYGATVGFPVPSVDQRGVNRGPNIYVGAYHATTPSQLAVSGPLPLAVNGSPQLAVATAPQTFTVTAEDSCGKTVYDYSGAINITSTDPHGPARCPEPDERQRGL
jgi:hypothetical protein